MSQDYEFHNVAQDNSELILYIKEMLLEPAKELHHKPFEPTIVINKDITLIMDLLHNKVLKYFIYKTNRSRDEKYVH